MQLPKGVQELLDFVTVIHKVGVFLKGFELVFFCATYGAKGFLVLFSLADKFISGLLHGLTVGYFMIGFLALSMYDF